MHLHYYYYGISYKIQQIIQFLPNACNFVVEATIVVATNNVTYQDRIAAFGPRLADEGLLGYLVSVEMIEANNQKGCSKLKRKAPTNQWIALVERGQCTFIEKVRSMQASGAIAVVVGDNKKNGLITMYATGDTSDVIIPSVFIAQTDLKSLIAEKPVEAQLVKDNLSQWSLLNVIIIVILSLTVMMIFIYVLWRIRQRQRRKQNITPRRIATKIFFESKRQEEEPQECAICLEDYADEDELRILPCKHEFHIVCVDSWLTTKEKFCPICKRDISNLDEPAILLSSQGAL
ncbi:E3 ubiquitin-protein ligase RNF13 isoform X1 [Rhizophagus clarus]|uniref:RING-type E3 ubiquitin transferase n=1 Tax=Rhizophagus clarus TaxID=94130 RepID=A0A8H3M954_9GLOM|nr:E3 ubiquitin-protein ligase RNF13 isoform X1 [Rhizophagus clarus]